jgi:hypothetical protein
MMQRDLPVLARKLLRLVFIEVWRAPPSRRKKVAVRQMWMRMEAARRLAKALDLPVDRWWMAIAEEVEASDDPLEVLRRYLIREEPAEAERAEAPDLRLVEEKLALFDRILEEVLRDPEGVERGVYKRAEFFEAFYRWARSALRGDLPEGLGAKLRSALEVAHYCRPGGLMYAIREAERLGKPLPPEHPAVYAIRRYAKTWLHT